MRYRTQPVADDEVPTGAAPDRFSYQSNVLSIKARSYALRALEPVSGSQKV
jgi:hypothetical protein